jgi:hypothetical protein
VVSSTYKLSTYQRAYENQVEPTGMAPMDESSGSLGAMPQNMALSTITTTKLN